MKNSAEGKKNVPGGNHEWWAAPPTVASTLNGGDVENDTFRQILICDLKCLHLLWNLGLALKFHTVYNVCLIGSAVVDKRFVDNKTAIFRKYDILSTKDSVLST